MTKLVKLKSNRAVKKPAPSRAGLGRLDIPDGPLEWPDGACGGGGGGGALPGPVDPSGLEGRAEGSVEAGWGPAVGESNDPGDAGDPDEPVGRGEVGSLPAGRLNDGCSGGFWSDMAFPSK
ncbi:hypothetical protein GCM10028802_19060 [Terrabacter terrigena]